MMSTDHHVDRYAHQLLLALRGREVPSDRIAEVVAEVESHVAETGEDPWEAFGTPQEYAAAVAGARTAPRAWTWLAILLGGAAGYLSAMVVFALVVQERDIHGVPLVVAAPLALLLAATAAVTAQWHHRPVVDPRTGRRRLPGGGGPTVVVLLVSLAAVAGVAALTRGLG
ncbi:HAAS signaling domain-containing protein [Nocardioides sp. SYSU DS0663]|uniref:HAAS signaling domain-containing protein n=1 Tax=Nocardioides sp. SYSU DS0663 TaxID=3416445 RepID=UPI003F4B1613